MRVVSLVKPNNLILSLMYPEEGTTAGALQHSYCGHYEWILAARVVWGVFHVVWERGCTRER